MNLPTTEECERLWDEFAVPSNVREHAKKVTKVAVFLAERFKEAGMNINIELVEKAALLHDLIRVCNFKTFDCKRYRTEPPTDEELARWTELKEKYGALHHADAAFEVLKDKYPELAEVVKRHKYRLVGEKDGPKTWEDKIVNYADKRVTHARIVSIDERRRDAFERYRDDKTIVVEEKRFVKLQALEKEIFAKLDIKPEEVVKRIK